MSQIEGISGNGPMDVNDDHQALTDATTHTKDNFINAASGKVWSLPFEAIDPVGAGDAFLYVKNTGSVALRLTDTRISSTVAGIASIRKVSGTPSYVGESAITPVSRRTNKSPVLDAIVNTDTNITGLTDEGVWFFLPCDSAGKEQHLSTSSNGIIDPGHAVALYWDTATGALTGVISVVENGII